MTKKKQIEEIGPMPNEITYDDLMSKCMPTICSQPAGMVFFSSDEICNSIIKAAPNFEESNIAYEVNAENPCMSTDIEDDFVLSGFYIKLANPLPDNHVAFVFEPIWVNRGTGSSREIVTNGIPVCPTKYLKSDENLGPFLIPQAISTAGFRHNLFQFNNDAVVKGLTQAYISWYALKALVENSDYVGISGSLIVTDNFNLAEINGGRVVKRKCSQSYFTYRFSGFNSYATDEPSFPTAIKKMISMISTSSKTEILIKSNHVLKEENVVINPFIPGETWATPCPPVWIPG